MFRPDMSILGLFNAPFSFPKDEQMYRVAPLIVKADLKHPLISIQGVNYTSECRGTLMIVCYKRYIDPQSATQNA
jgi:hypothetical protein